MKEEDALNLLIPLVGMGKVELPCPCGRWKLTVINHFGEDWRTLANQRFGRRRDGAH